MNTGNRRRGILIGVLFVCTLAAAYGGALWRHVRLARDPGAFNNDARQWIVPYFRFEDSALFNNDYAGDYHLACAPAGFRSLYTGAALLGGVKALSKSLPYPLLLLTVGATALVAYRFGGPFAAWCSAALCLGSSDYLGRMAGGLPRSFAFPLLACVMVALAYGRVRLLVLCVWLGAAFYPMAGVLAGICLLIMLLDPVAEDRGVARAWALRKRVAVVVGTAIVALLILLPVGVLSARFGPLITPARSHQFPEAGPGGRYSSHNRPPFQGVLLESVAVLSTALPGAGEPLSGLGRWFRADPSDRRLRLSLFGLLAIASVGWVRLAWKHAAARRILFLPAAALLGHSLARLSPPHLYTPNRYILYGMPGVAIVVLAAGTIGLVPKRVAERRPWLPHLVVTAFCALALLILGSRGSPDVGLDIRVDASDPVYRFVGALPADSLIAGWPSGALDNASYVARRQAFVTFETHQAFHATYVLEMRRRTDALIDAYFATSPEPLVRLRREFGVTHLLVDLDEARRRAATYFKPFDLRINEAVARIGNQDLEVVRQLGDAAVFRRGKMAVLDLRRIEAPFPPGKDAP